MGRGCRSRRRARRPRRVWRTCSWRRSPHRPDATSENVDKTREFIEAYNRRDFETAIRWFDPQVQWVLPEHQGFDSCVGPDQIIKFWEGLDETMDELRLLPQEYVDAGDHVAVRLRHFARGKGSGVELDNELYHQVSTFRAGKMIRIEYLTSWPEALRIAGIDGEHPPLP